MHLKGLKKLEWLDLSRTDITDAGLDHLSELTGLTNSNCKKLKFRLRLRKNWKNFYRTLSMLFVNKTLRQQSSGSCYNGVFFNVCCYVFCC